MKSNEIYHKLTQAGEAWAEANRAADLLEETKKVVLAQITTVIFDSEGCSRKEAEDRALGSKQYEEHVKSMVDARYEANKAKVNYSAAQEWVWSVRTESVTKRKEMEFSGVQT